MRTTAGNVTRPSGRPQGHTPAGTDGGMQTHMVTGLRGGFSKAGVGSHLLASTEQHPCRLLEKWFALGFTP